MRASGSVDVADPSVVVAGTQDHVARRCSRRGRRCRPGRPTCTPAVPPARRARRRRSASAPSGGRREKKQSLKTGRSSAPAEAVDGQVPRPQQRRVGGEAVVVARAHRDDVIERGGEHEIGRRRHAPDQADAGLGGQRVERPLPVGRPVRRGAQGADPEPVHQHPVLLDRAHAPPAGVVEPAPEERRVDGMGGELVDPPFPLVRGTATAARCDGSGSRAVGGRAVRRTARSGRCPADGGSNASGRGSHVINPDGGTSSG